jgi:putative oxidoreductase
MMVQMRRLSNFQNVAPLLLRLGVGSTFFFAGLGKVLGGTAGVAGFFGSLGIPLPMIMGPFISYLELLGGLAILVGLFTRVFGILFVCTMLVAIALVNLGALMGATTIPEGWNEIRTEIMLLVASAALAILGPGRFSVDAALLGDGDVAVAEPTMTTSTSRT